MEGKESDFASGLQQLNLVADLLERFAGNHLTLASDAIDSGLDGQLWPWCQLAGHVASSESQTTQIGWQPVRQTQLGPSLLDWILEDSEANTDGGVEGGGASKPLTANLNLVSTSQTRKAASVLGHKQ